MLLLSSDQLAAILPSIRKRATALLAGGRPEFRRTQDDSRSYAARPPGSGSASPGPRRAGDPPDTSARQRQQPASRSTPRWRPEPAHRPERKPRRNPPGNQHGSQGQQASPDNTANQTAPPGAIVLSDILGTGPASGRSGDECSLPGRGPAATTGPPLPRRAIRASAALLVVVAVLWIVGSIHPAYFPLCWPVPGSNPAMICPTGGSKPTRGRCSASPGASTTAACCDLVRRGCVI